MTHHVWCIYLLLILSAPCPPPTRRAHIATRSALVPVLPPPARPCAAERCLGSDVMHMHAARTSCPADPAPRRGRQRCAYQDGSYNFGESCSIVNPGRRSGSTSPGRGLSPLENNPRHAGPKKSLADPHRPERRHAPFPSRLVIPLPPPILMSHRRASDQGFPDAAVCPCLNTRGRTVAHIASQIAAPI